MGVHARGTRKEVTREDMRWIDRGEWEYVCATGWGVMTRGCWCIYHDANAGDAASGDDV